MKEKVILAYSGGLDTTAIIPWLKETYDFDVVCVCIDVGQESELDGLEERAKYSGAQKLYILDVVDEFCDDYIVPGVQANAVYENKYTNIDERKLAQEDFSKCLKCVYSLNVLNEALSELKKISNCSSAKGIARKIIKLRRRYLHSCMLKELTQEIIKAINTYDEGPNFELIRAEDERNFEKRAAFWGKVKAVGREIF